MPIKYKDFPGWELTQVLDSGYFEVTCNKKIAFPTCTFPMPYTVAAEYYRLYIEGFYPTYVLEETFEEWEKHNFWKVWTNFRWTDKNGKIQNRLAEHAGEDHEHYFDNSGLDQREMQAVKFVRHHISITATKFAVHNYLKAVLNLDVHKVCKVTIAKNKIYTSYMLGDRGSSGKGCTILGQKRVENLVNYDHIDWMPVRDPYFHSNPAMAERYGNGTGRNMCGGFIITMPNFNAWEDPIQFFVCGRPSDEMGYTRMSVIPPYTDVGVLEVEFDRGRHKYSSSFCIYEAIFAYNGGTEEVYHDFLVPRTIRSSIVGFDPNKDPNKKKG